LNLTSLSHRSGGAWSLGKGAPENIRKMNLTTVRVGAYEIGIKLEQFSPI